MCFVSSSIDTWVLFFFKVSIGKELASFPSHTRVQSSNCSEGEYVQLKPPKRDRIGDWMFGPCREVGVISEVFIVCHYNPPHNDRA